MLATAELSYLPDRRQAFENLAKRVPLDGVKSLCIALQQSERFGTPMATTLRVIAQENRDMRMTAAEKKAAALPPQADDPVLSAGAVHRDSWTGHHQDRGDLQVTARDCAQRRSFLLTPDFAFAVIAAKAGDPVSPVVSVSA
jgi:hypothetical protein